MLLRRGFSLASYVNCAFDPLSYRKHVLACWQWNRMFRAFCYKKTAISFFVSEYPFSSLIVAKIRFCMLATKSRCFEFYVTKKKRFCFLVAETRWTRLYSTENMFGLFAVILGCLQSYCTKKSSLSESPWFSLDFTESSFWGQPCSLFP